MKNTLILTVSAIALLSSQAGAQTLSASCPLVRDEFVLDVTDAPSTRTVIRTGGTYTGGLGEDTFRILGDDAQGLNITGGLGLNTVDVSVVQFAGEQIVLDGTAATRNLTLSDIDNVLGSSAGDAITGNVNVNLIAGYGGDDVIDGINSDNIITGGAGNDTIFAGTGNDYASGGMDDDFIRGLAGDDVLDGGPGRDVMFGGSGDDLIISGAGGDYEPFLRPQPIPSTKSQNPQDVVVVLFDDLASFGDLLADPEIVMPNLYAFSQGAVRFNNAQANSPICNPSRASLLAGVYPETSKVYGSLQNRNTEDAALIQRHLQDNGFDVGEFGKVRNHTESSDDIGIENHFYRFRQVDASGTFGVVQVDDRAHLSELYSDGASVDAAIEFINQESGKPKATFLGITRPHGPWIVPQEDMDVINSNITDDDIRARAAENGQTLGAQDLHWLTTLSEYTTTALGISSGLGTEASAINLIRHYLASAHLADRLFGEFMAQVPDGVTVIATSDHGMHLSDRRSGLSKSTLWPQSLDVPLYIRANGYAGDRSEIVGLVDLYGTIADLSGVDTPAHVEGRSLEPLLRGAAGWDNVTTGSIGQQNGTRASRHHDWIGWSVTTNDWHFIRDKEGNQELYDMQSDPNGRINIADAMPDVTKSLSAYLPRWDDYMYGGAGSDFYTVGGGLTFINEGGPRSAADIDQVRLNANFDDLTFDRVSWGSNDGGNSMAVRHNGGVTVLYNQYSPSLSQIEVLHLNDGCVFLD